MLKYDQRNVYSFLRQKLVTIVHKNRPNCKTSTIKSSFNFDQKIRIFDYKILRTRIIQEHNVSNRETYCTKYDSIISIHVPWKGVSI